MMVMNKLKDKGFSDGEIQLMRSIKPRTIMNIELVHPDVVHNEVIIGYDIYPIIVKAKGIFIHEARVSHTLPIRLGYVCYSSGLRLLFFEQLAHFIMSMRIVFFLGKSCTFDFSIQ